MRKKLNLNLIFKNLFFMYIYVAAFCFYPFVLGGYDVAANPKEIKVALMIKIANLLYWPENQKSYFNVCIRKEPEIAYYFKNYSLNSEINRKRIKVYDNVDLANIDGCDLLFVAPSDEINIPQIIEKTKGKPICTIADTHGFAEKGIMVNFVRSETKVGFEINIDAVEKTGIKFSSHVLKKAQIVGTKQ